VIRKISSYRLRNAELLQFNRQLLEMVRTHDPEKLKVTAQFQAHLDAFKVAEGAFKKTHALPLTKELAELDKKRDQLFQGIHLLVQGNACHFEKVPRQCAVLLKEHIDSFGINIRRQNYMRESALLNKLVTDWRANALLYDAVTTLGLTNWLNQLADVNRAFDECYLERNKMLSKITPDKFREKRDDLSNAYQKLISRLNSHYDIAEGAEPFASVAVKINALSERYRLLIPNGKSSEAEQHD